RSLEVFIGTLSNSLCASPHTSVSVVLTSCLVLTPPCFLLFSFNAPAPPEIYTLSLHDALPIAGTVVTRKAGPGQYVQPSNSDPVDRKSTRLNSSHQIISYAVFCLKKKKKKQATSLQ